MLSLAVALVSVVVAIVAVMTIPVSLVVHAEWTDQRQTSWRITWLFGLVNVELTRRKARSRESPRVSTETRDRSSAQSHARRRRGFPVVLALVRTEGFVGHTLRLLRGFGRLATFEGAYARAGFGLDDPADTGRLYGVLAPVCIAANAAGLDVGCQPRFVQQGFEGSCGGRMQIRPISLVSLLARFLCSPSALRAIRAAWKARR